MKTFAELAFTSGVRKLQIEHGSRANYARMENAAPLINGMSEAERMFISQADSFYLATVSESGWPYVQHRGGPQGFIKVVSPTRIAFPEFRGNRQYVSAGNAQHNDRVSLIFVDYPTRQRLKLMGRLSMLSLDEADPALIKQLQLPDYQAKLDAIAVIDIEAFDWNCPQHITPRFTEAEIKVAVAPLYERIAELEAEVSRLNGLSLRGNGNT